MCLATEEAYEGIPGTIAKLLEIIENLERRLRCQTRQSKFLVESLRAELQAEKEKTAQAEAEAKEAKQAKEQAEARAETSRHPSMTVYAEWMRQAVHLAKELQRRVFCTVVP